MTDLNYYDPLTTVNESEQKTLGSMRKDFSNAIGKCWYFSRYYDF